ncbi:DNA mismatch repair protein msh6 [Thoreauomyces humboldtii]|nr:DNA mismatch repair protein msh6 [Thoreauomyces humboldtii]
MPAHSQTPSRKQSFTPKTPKSQQTTLTSFFSLPRNQVATPTQAKVASPVAIDSPLTREDQHDLRLMELAQQNEKIWTTPSLLQPRPESTISASGLCSPSVAVAIETGSDDDVPLVRRRLRKRGKAAYIESDEGENENLVLDDQVPERPSSAKRPRTRKADDDWEVTPEDVAELDLMEIEDASCTMDRKNAMATPTARSKIAHLERRSASSPLSATTPNTFRTSFAASMDSTEKQTRVQKFKEKNEGRYAWLLDVKDEEGRRPGEEGYDSRTLFIPGTAWRSFTPFEKQFWEIKCKHWSTVVFFKKGKFFELYEKDADIGHQHFDLKMTDRTNMRMVGVPESSFDHWAAQFLAKGYRVAKVDQTENAVGKAMRDREEKGSKPKDKIINRELTCILTTGTLIDSGLLTNDMGTYCMAIKEVQRSDSHPPSFGVAFVDTATAEFSLCAFDDDMERTQLETLIMQLKPKELVLEKGCFSKASVKLVKNSLGDLDINYLVPGSEFWTAERAEQELENCKYFVDLSRSDATSQWPSVLREAEPHALEAFGGLLWYLRSLMIDKQLVSAKNFRAYDPIRHAGALILDGQTLLNLEIFQNTYDGSDRGTLHNLLNHAVTPFGKRLFKRWLCHPLRSIPEINERLNAVDDLNSIPSQQETLYNILRKLPDLERLISRVHAGSVRVKEFLTTLDSFQSIADLIEELGPFVPAMSSRLLKKIFQNGMPKSLSDTLEYFEKAFDQKLAAETDKIELHAGYDAQFDQACDAVQDIENLLEQHKKEWEKKLKCKITFKDMGKELFQMEISRKVDVPRDWSIKSKTAAVNRWWSPRAEELVTDFMEAREIKDEALRNIKLRLCQRFDESYEDWLQLVRSIAELDCLMSLAKCQQSIGEPSCRPEFIEGGPSTLEIEEMRHPCITAGPGSDFIPNDLLFGGSDKPNMILLTGPNMGGKSTLLRQTCIAVIMAQLGCYVPAQRCRMTIFDRIFTRLGANDNIMAGQSTFMVELAETCKIMKEATPHSLVILDELGRGTSTFDGYAIAHAVLYHLITHVRCLGLFSTHYRMLTNEYADHPLIAMKYMSFMTDEEKREVTFLYKLTDGCCPKSYGMNCAAMAGIAPEIVDRAETIAATFQRTKELSEESSARPAKSSLMRLTNFAVAVKALNDPERAPELLKTLLRVMRA